MFWQENKTLKCEIPVWNESANLNQTQIKKKKQILFALVIYVHYLRMLNTECGYLRTQRNSVFFCKLTYKLKTNESVIGT